MSAPKKVLYVITKSNFGGAQRYVYDLARAAGARGFEVAVVTGGTGVLTEKLTEAGVRVIPLGLVQGRTFLGDLLSFGSLFSLIRTLRRERPDVVHVNSAKAGGLGALAGRLARVPRIIFTAHGWEFNAPRSALSRAGIRLFSWITILLSHVTICVSEAIWRDVAWMPGVKAKTVVVYNGTQMREYLSREEARRVLAPPSVGKYWVGMMSELNATKRVEDAIEAFAIVVQKHPDVILIVLGAEGPERQRLEWLIRDLHLGNNVSLPGFRADATSLLKAFDLFLHTSQSEALSLAVLEAGAAGLPVVATSVGGIPEIIPDEGHGLLVPVRSPAAIAEAIDRVLTGQAAGMGERLRARVARAFTKERMIEETFKQY